MFLFVCSLETHLAKLEKYFQMSHMFHPQSVITISHSQSIALIPELRLSSVIVITLNIIELYLKLAESWL